MIFSSKNEAGVPAWELVLQGEKTITRRGKFLSPLTQFAVQPGRGKKAVCRAQVVSCMPHREFNHIVSGQSRTDLKLLERLLEDEARMEGFASWRGLLGWLESKHIKIGDTYRIEFAVVLLK